jgi:hypothetical protein
MHERVLPIGGGPAGRTPAPLLIVRCLLRVARLGLLEDGQVLVPQALELGEQTGRGHPRFREALSPTAARTKGHIGKIVGTSA